MAKGRGEKPPRRSSVATWPAVEPSYTFFTWPLPLISGLRPKKTCVIKRYLGVLMVLSVLHEEKSRPGPQVAVKHPCIGTGLYRDIEVVSAHNDIAGMAGRDECGRVLLGANGSNVLAKRTRQWSCHPHTGCRDMRRLLQWRRWD